MLQDITLRQLLAISLGAIAGALTRYYLTFWLTLKFGDKFSIWDIFLLISVVVQQWGFLPVGWNKKP